MRGHLARLVVVVAVLTGLGLAIALHCTGATARPMAHGANTVCVSPTVITASQVADRVAPAGTTPPAVPCAPLGAAGSFAVDDHSPDSGALGGVLVTCLALILAVVASMAALRPDAFRRVARRLRAARVVPGRAVPQRAPSLAALCVLRT